MDRHDSRLRHALGRVAKRDDLVLRVVYDPEREPSRDRGRERGGALTMRRKSEGAAASQSRRRRTARPNGPPDSRTGRDRIAAGRIYDDPRPDDGARVLVMRLWPRGVRKDRVTLWLRELGPEAPLMRSFLRGDTSWEEYSRRYLGGLGRPEAQAALDDVRRLARSGPVTLLCWCADEQRCHRSLLRNYLARHVV